jgi:hypothetical protein
MIPPLLMPVLFSLLACEAEQFGVHLPTGGADAITAADLRWDLWRITDPRLGGRAPGSSGSRRVAKRIASRLIEAGFSPGWAGAFRRSAEPDTGELVCGVKRGRTDEAILVAALDPGIGTISAVPIAGLIALSAAFEGPSIPTHSMVFCVLPEAGGLAAYARNPVLELSDTRAYFVLGSLTGGTLLVEDGPLVFGLSPILLHTGPLAARLKDDMDRVRFGAVTARTRVAYSVLRSVE